MAIKGENEAKISIAQSDALRREKEAEALKIAMASEKVQQAKALEEITPEAEQALLDKITQRYENQTTPYYAAARLWVDAIINPMETRTWISMGIEAANHAPVETFHPGILQV